MSTSKRTIFYRRAMPALLAIAALWWSAARPAVQAGDSTPFFESQTVDVTKAKPEDYYLTQRELPDIYLAPEPNTSNLGWVTTSYNPVRTTNLNLYMFILHEFLEPNPLASGMAQADSPARRRASDFYPGVAVRVFSTAAAARYVFDDLLERDAKLGRIIWTDTSFPQLGANGAAKMVEGGIAYLIHYKTAACYIFSDAAIKRRGLQRAAFDPKNPYDMSDQEAAGHVKTVANLWLNKVAGLKGAEPPQKPTSADLPDLYIEPEWIALSSASDVVSIPWEQAADKQAVYATIQNRGDVDAENVYLQLYAGRPDDQNPPAVGNPVSIGTIPKKGELVHVTAVWDLQGKNIENTKLWVKAYIPHVEDQNPSDNRAGITCNIWYAFNGQRAFNWQADSYSFKNFGWDDRDIEETVDGLLATIIGNWTMPELDKKLWKALVFPGVYGKVRDYFVRSMTNGAGGHCYGMSATVGLFFEDPGLKPTAKAVSAMTKEEAAASINMYHRAQMPTVLQMLAGKEANRYMEDLGAANCYNWIKNALSFSRLAPIIGFYGESDVRGKDGKVSKETWGHAVLAYKLIKEEKRDPVVYIYDPNYPPQGLQKSSPMSQITLVLDRNKWSSPSYMTYLTARGDWIGAHRVFREVPLETANTLSSTLKRLGYLLVGGLRGTQKILAVLRCPADLCLTDGQNRRIGKVNGKTVNEIPGGEVWLDGEAAVYALPADGSYRASVTGTGEGKFSLSIIRSTSGDRFSVSSFEDVPVRRGQQVTGIIAPGPGQFELSGARAISGILALSERDLGISAAKTQPAMQPGVPSPVPPSPAPGKPSRPGISSLLGKNLIANGGGEMDRASPDGRDVVPITGWTVNGKVTLARYDSPNIDFAGIRPGAPVPPNRGANFFTGGPDNPASSATQTTSVADESGLIDSGKVKYLLSAYLGGFEGQDDNATLAAVFRNAQGGTIGEAKIGPVLNADRRGKDGLMRRETSGYLPAGTRSIVFRLAMTRTSGRYNDGYADELSFVLSGQ